MYDLPELRAAHDAFWSEVRERLQGLGVEAPRALTRGTDLVAEWTDPGLLLGQTCGYPLVTFLKGRVRLVAMPRYRAEGCEGALYRSAIVIRATDTADGLAALRGRRCAVNDPASQSGMNALRAAVAPLAPGARFFGEVVWTGSHANSVRAVVEGRADTAAIDCVTWAHLQHFRPQTTDCLRVVGWTEATPGLPMITSCHADEHTCEVLLRALSEVAAEPVCGPLLIDGFEHVPLEAYDAITRMKVAAERLGHGDFDQHPTAG